MLVIQIILNGYMVMWSKDYFAGDVVLTWNLNSIAAFTKGLAREVGKIRLIQLCMCLLQPLSFLP